LRSLPYFGVLHFSRSYGADDPGHDSRFQIIVKDVSTRKSDPACAGARQLRMIGFKARHMTRGIAGPGLAADILIEAAVTVGYDIESRNFLIPQINRQRIRVWLAELVVGHRIHERLRSEVFCVPARSRKRSV